MKSVLISIQPYYVFLIIAKIMGWGIGKEKTVEVRKNYPKDKSWNKIARIYCSKNKQSFNQIPKEYQPLMRQFLGKVIGEFVCDETTEYEGEFYDDETQEYIKKVIHTTDWDGYPEIDYSFIAENGEENSLCNTSCLTWQELRNYMGEGINTFYAWRISDLKIYDKPKELSEFKQVRVIRGYHKKGESQIEKLLNSSRLEVKYLKRPPQSWCYVGEGEGK